MSQTIINGDSAEVLKQFEDNTIDTIVTSPPYNLKGFRTSRGARGNQYRASSVWKNSLIDYTQHNDDIDESEYRLQQIEFINECLRCIKPTGSIFYQHKLRRWNAHSSHPVVWIGQTRANFYQEIIWDRGGTIAMDPHYLLPTTESIYWLTKQKPMVYRKRLPEAYRKTIWSIPLQRVAEHPAPFPVLLARLCIQLATPKGGLGGRSLHGQWHNRNGGKRVRYGVHWHRPRPQLLCDSNTQD
jgi:site-specific DNA-methyltransferase (adenine-specific)